MSQGDRSFVVTAIRDRSVWLLWVACFLLAQDRSLAAESERSPTLPVIASDHSTAPPAQEDGKDGEDDDDDSDEDDAEKKGKTYVPKTDLEKYVHEKLGSFLSPSKIRWHEDGRVTLTFDFSDKSEDHVDIFTRPVGATLQEKLRWTTQDEEFVIGGIAGMRVSDKGSTTLRAWFKDNVEAEITFRQYINHSSRHLMTLLFQNEKGSAIGTNYGNQYALFSKGRLKKKAGGKIKGVNFDKTSRFKFKMKDGVFEVYRDGYLAGKTKYKPKTFPRGQIGVLWGGSQSGTIGSLTITGELDHERMKAEMKKKRSRSRRR